MLVDIEVGHAALHDFPCIRSIVSAKVRISSIESLLLVTRGTIAFLVWRGRRRTLGRHRVISYSNCVDLLPVSLMTQAWSLTCQRRLIAYEFGIHTYRSNCAVLWSMTRGRWLNFMLLEPQQ